MIGWEDGRKKRERGSPDRSVQYGSLSSHRLLTLFVLYLPPFLLPNVREGVKLDILANTMSNSMGFGKGGTGAIIKERTSIALDTLGQNTAIKLDGAPVVLAEDFRILKSELFAAVSGLTAGQGGGLHLGIANDELSAAEIAEAINLSGPVSRNDALQSERAMRAVWLISALDGSDVNTVDSRFKGKAGGPMITWKKRWSFFDPQGWIFFIWNEDAAISTGATARVVATHYGVWLS